MNEELRSSREQRRIGRQLDAGYVYRSVIDTQVIAIDRQRHECNQENSERRPPGWDVRHCGLIQHASGPGYKALDMQPRSVVFRGYIVCQGSTLERAPHVVG